jgi:hypothetical protein
MELHNKGWGYTKIHTYLRKNGFEIGKSRQTVNTMIKKMKKRDEFYHQSIMDGYGNFRVEWREGSLKFEKLINIGDTVLVL